MRVRITNSTDIETNTVERVEPTMDGYRVVFTDGGATRFRMVQLTKEGQAALFLLSRRTNG